ncbi:hypothetical protein [uncultured Fluviicola sp.]|uniref:hypothetical protein n=1 Tax=uncultured Fluviicola sp. TaxID=463303 RepID=UPI0025DB30F4|nr:hypothetical protein [uncultured Fluviicola sp.]
MKKNTFKTVFFAAGVLMLPLAACKKESVIPNGKTKSKTEIDPAKRPVYQEGIVSHNGFDAFGDIISGYYEFYGPYPGSQYVNGTHPASTTNQTLKGCAASTGNIIYAYKTASGLQVLDGGPIISTVILNSTGTAFTLPIEEIEIHPQTGEVYALVGSSNKSIVSINPSTGFATPLTVNGGSTTIFTGGLMNGYKCGSIAFVPDGFGGSELVFSHESDVYASSGIVSWHFTISGTNLISNVANHRTYAGIPGTVGSGINTTYGNGKLYFARHGSSNPVYSLSLTSNTFASEGFSVTNNNDFGYWKAF